MYHYFMFNRDEFLTYYHRRSNIESALWIIKASLATRLGPRVITGEVIEAPAKVLCHNLCCLIHAMHALGVELNFDAKSHPALKLVD